MSSGEYPTRYFIGMTYNPSNYTTESTNTGLTKEDADNYYLHKNGGIDTSLTTTTFQNPIYLNNNIITSSKTISPLELSQLDGIDVNIKNKLDVLQSSIGGVYSGSNNYTGDNIYLGSSSFTAMTLTNNGVSTQLNSKELSYIDGTTSNIQQQLNTLNTNKQNLITTPVNNNLVSMNTQGQTVNNNISITNDDTLTTVSNNLLPSSIAIKNYVDNKINNLSYESTVGQPVIFYFSNSNNNIVGYEDLLNKPDTLPEDIEMIQLNNNRVLLHGYASSALNRTLIPGGIWSFTFYGYVNDNASLTRYEVEIYKSNNGIETLLGTIMSGDINLTSVGVISFNGTIVNDTIINLTDKLVIKIYGFTTVSNKTINLYFYHSGSNHNSYVSSPLTLSHNDLAGLNIGDYQHLTQAQKTKATQYATISQDGLLSSSNFNTFNNKENTITAGTTSQYYRGDKTFQLLDKNAVGLSNVDNTADSNKPISNLTQTALNYKQDILTNTSLVTVNTISDSVGNIRTGINDLTNKFYQVFYVCGVNGDDNNSGNVLNKPLKTITKALSLGGANSGINIIIAPGTYSENITMNLANITISSIVGYEKGGLINLTGNFNITTNNTPTSSVRLLGLSMNSLNITGNASVYLDSCKISTALNKYSSAYLEIKDCNINTSLYFDCSNAIINILNSNIPAFITQNNTVNNTNNQYNFSNNLVLGPITMSNSAILGVNNSTVYAAFENTPSITVTGSCYVYISNSSLLYPNNTFSKVSFTNSYYSFQNVNYYKPTSTFTNCISIDRKSHFDTINALNGFETNGVIISPTELSQLDGINTNQTIQQQINNISSGSAILGTTNEWTGLNNTFNNTATFYSVTLNGSVLANSTFITPTEISRLTGISSNIQTQINNKLDISSNTVVTLNGTTNLKNINLTGNISANSTTITPTEISRLTGITSNIQTQLNNLSGPVWVSIATSNNMTTLISSSTATPLQKIYSVSTGNGPTYTNITMPNNYYLDYQYCIFGKTLKLKYNFLCKDKTGQSAGYQAYLFPIDVPNVIVNTALVSTKSDWPANQNYGSVTADVANGYNWEGFNYSSKIGTGWVSNGIVYSAPTEVILFNYTTNLINNQPHPWNYKAVMMSIGEGSFRPFITDNRAGFNGTAWINYKFECEIPIL